MELRTGEAVPAMLLFSVSTFVLFHFALDRASVEGELAAGVLWMTLLFAAMLGMSRLFVAEREQGGFDGFLLAPVDRTSLFVAKAAVLFSFLVAVELAAVPAFSILLLGPSPWPVAPELVLVLLLADLGHRRRRHAGRRARDPDAGAGADRADPRAAADDPARDRRCPRHVAAVPRGGRRGAAGPLAARARPL